MKDTVEWIIFGEGYDEQIKLVDNLGTILYLGNCDYLVDSIDEEICLNLNFGKTNNFLHILKNQGKYILLMPSLSLIESHPRSNHKYRKTYIIEITVFKQLWKSLRYDSAKIETVRPPEKDDWLIFWFSNISQVNLNQPLDIWMKWLCTKILAEDIDGVPNTIEIIRYYSFLEFDNESLVYSDNIQPIITYIDDETGLVEWRSLNSVNRNELILKSNWKIRSYFIDRQS
jgi:hypothetical protein